MFRTCISVFTRGPFIEQEFETDKLAILDIKARDPSGRFLNVEMQKSLTQALRDRLVYYAACLYSSQMSEGDAYPDLRPTIGICLLSAIMFPKTPAGHLKFVLSNLQQLSTRDVIVFRVRVARRRWSGPSSPFLPETSTSASKLTRFNTVPKP
ncbi:MAG: Rpn family recombination-promoting nuclease/putative transposase [Fuerstia sp.]|nr:Rpn family recombination-promoting nuclease/putative transposase [Fuerstiella sp.]